MAASSNVNVRSLATHTKRRVFFTGSTALLAGQFVNFNKTAGTATAIDGSRDNDVAQPTTATNYAFSGVVSQTYDARSGGQDIEIYTEGYCLALVIASQTIAINTLVGGICASNTAANVGCFGHAGVVPEGRGTAWVRQTVTVSSAPVLCLVELFGKENGVQSGEVEELLAVAGAQTGTSAAMIGGITFYQTATINSDHTFTIANGTQIGMQKALVIQGTQTTSNVVGTYTTAVAPNGKTMDTLATTTMHTIGDQTSVRWDGYQWVLIGSKGATLG